MTEKNAFLQSFLDANPKLAKTKAEIRIDEILQKYSSETNKSEKYDPPIIEISITHPFIFDRRLIPNQFNGYAITGGMSGEFPSEFPICDEGLIELHVWYNPENYIAFVNNNIEIIRTELDDKSMTKEDALDALTGGFEKHVEWCISSKEKFKDSN